MSIYNDNNDLEMMDALFLIFVFFVVLYLVIIAMIWITAFTIVAGTAFGGSVSLYNYGMAFKNQVKREKPTR